MHRRYTGREQEQLIEAVRTSGKPVKEVAKQFGVSTSTAYLWVKAAPSERAPRFVQLVPSQAETKESASLVLRVGGAAIEVDTGFDAELLRAVVSALAARVA